MFTELYLENYKSFKKLKLNLSSNNRPKKIVAVYGENGSGKSNIVSAFTNLALSLRTVRNQAEFSKIQAQVATADDDSEHSTQKQMVMDILKSSKFDNSEVMDVFKDTYMLSETAPMEIKYTFNINGKSGYYQLIFKKNEGETYLYSEKLYYLINKASGTMFEISSTPDSDISMKWSPSLFSGKMLDLAKDDVKRFWGKHTFLSIFNNIAFQNNKQYIASNVSENFVSVIRAFNRLSFKNDNATGVSDFSKLLRSMLGGTITDNERNQGKVKTTQLALNKYFVPLYSDILRLFFQKKGVHEGKFSYELFEEKRIAGKSHVIPFRLESHGTKQLLTLFPLFLSAVHGETVVIDELDQGIHDLLVDRLIDSVKDDLEGQLIFTTHDTQVMRELDVSSLYVIQSDAKGNKQVVNLSNNGKTNIAAHNNVQKMYLEGYFSGVPYADDVDFYDILSDLEVE